MGTITEEENEWLEALLRVENNSLDTWASNN